MLNNYFPNVAQNWQAFTQSIQETVEMVILSGLIAFIVSIFLAIILIITKRGGIKENFIFFNIFDKLINLFRSIPFIILIVALIPLTTLISGTAIGVAGTIFPLVVGITPFFARQI